MNAAQAKKRIVTELEEITLGEILKAPKMPQRTTVNRWLREDAVFAGKCLEAKRARAEMLIDLHQNELLTALEEVSAKVAASKIRHLEWYLERIVPNTYAKRKEKGEDPGESLAKILAAARRRVTIDATPELPDTVQ